MKVYGLFTTFSYSHGWFNAADKVLEALFQSKEAALARIETYRNCEPYILETIQSFPPTESGLMAACPFSLSSSTGNAFLIYEMEVLP